MPEKGGRTTYNVGMITGGTSVNTIAQQAQMLYEFRSESRENMDYMEKMFLDVIEQVKSEGADVDLEVIACGPAAVMWIRKRNVRWWNVLSGR